MGLRRPVVRHVRQPRLHPRRGRRLQTAGQVDVAALACWLAAKARRYGLFEVPDHLAPEPGDIVLYDFDGHGVAEHTGLYEKAAHSTPGGFYALEGNTDNMSARRKRTETPRRWRSSGSSNQRGSEAMISSWRLDQAARALQRPHWQLRSERSSTP